MSLEWRGDLLGNLREILAKTQRLDDDVAVGARIILTDSNERVPKRAGDLAKSGQTAPAGKPAAAPAPVPVGAEPADGTPTPPPPPTRRRRRRAHGRAR